MVATVTWFYFGAITREWMFTLMLSLTDEDECITRSEECQDVCLNTPGGFECSCTQLAEVPTSLLPDVVVVV